MTMMQTKEIDSHVWVRKLTKREKSCINLYMKTIIYSNRKLGYDRLSK